VEKQGAYQEKLWNTYYDWQLVFVDESSTDRRVMFSDTAWSVRGSRAVRKVFFVQGKRSIIHSIQRLLCTKTYM
jgi:hypothetical protein